MNPKVDFYFNKAGIWQPAIAQLRRIALDCDLVETLKWGTPCYTFQDRNIVLIHEFKEYCALLFFKGALLQDIEGILVQQSENTQATRQIRFTDVREVMDMETVIKTYIYEAIEVEKAGLKVAFKPATAFAVAEEFQQKMDEMPALKAAFYALTPGRQRGYLLHFAAAKQAKTRVARVEKCVERIIDGMGLED